MLATCTAKIRSPFNDHPVRILLDPGSELSFVSNQLINTLGLVRQQSTIYITGIGGSPSTCTKGNITLELLSNISHQTVLITMHIISRLTNTLPSFNVQQNQWPLINKLQLADPDYGVPGPIDIIIGADYYGLIIKPEIIKEPNSSLIAQSTIFGWVIIGPVNESSSPVSSSHHITVERSNQELLDMLQKFWLQEEIQVKENNQLCPADQQCEDHFRANHTRDNEGRYTVRIPLNSSPNQLGRSDVTSQNCLMRTIKRLSNNSKYSQLYLSFMKEYEDMGHMKRVPIKKLSPERNVDVVDCLPEGMTLAHDTSVSGGLRVPESSQSAQTHNHNPYYLPHHGVLKEDSSTTKLRVVFNESSPTTTGVSVNDIQHVGAKLQRDIADILLWIRQFKYLFTTDITKMYRQINVHKNDWDLQRINWIDDQLNIIPYHLTTVTYGTRSAPFLAVRTILQLVEDEGHRFPKAKEPMLKGRYVDDIFGGSDQIKELNEIAQQVTQLCEAGKLPLAKWHSNNKKFIMIRSQQESHEKEHSFEESSTKLLGLSWNYHHDNFQFRSQPPHTSSKLTKRIILSETAQLYDPLGFLSPFIVRAKVLIQELWSEKLGWDEPVSDHIHNKWNSFRDELSNVSQITIPRWMQITSASQVELHGFSDASQLAMAAAIYIKVTDPGKQSTVHLMCAKSKVAPLKRLSIPRLELTAALIASKLMRYVQDVLELHESQTFMWTDSSVTLAWIKSHSSRWKEFVRNRVSAIQDLTSHAVWSYVPGKDNPADCAPRGLTISHLQKHKLWWTEPQWLINTRESWPDQPVTKTISLNHQEERPGLTFIVATHHPEYHWEMIHRYSTLKRLLRVTAYCFRVCEKFKGLPSSSLADQITPQELNTARVYWIKATQAAYFKSELKLLKSSQLPSTHPFNRLTAYIDTQGIIRVGGRLTRSQLELESMHPIILPRQSKFTDLIITDAHQQTLHGGTQLTLTYIRSAYWIIGGRNPVSSHILRCISCARKRGVRAQQQICQLPATRVIPSRAFAHSGVDYAGPLTIKSWKGRGAKQYKGWLCIFVCFATSAIHLEVVSDYSTDGFIAAFKRFISRRGICKTLHSDCGTNFQGANHTLSELFKKGVLEENKIITSLANDGTKWTFNPPAAPHMGGKWEAAVKSV